MVLAAGTQKRAASDRRGTAACDEQNPPEERVSEPFSVTVDAAVSRNELITFRSGTLGEVLAPQTHVIGGGPCGRIKRWRCSCRRPKQPCARAGGTNPSG